MTVESNGNLDGFMEAASSVAGNGNAGVVDVSHQGSVGGILATSFVGGNGNSGSVMVSASGNVFRGIAAVSTVAGSGDAAAVSVTNAGDVANPFASARLISAVSRAETDGDAGSVTVTSTGALTGGDGGIFAGSFAAGTGMAGGVVVGSTGNVLATGNGIEASSNALGTGNASLVAVTSTGDIDVGALGVWARSLAATGHAGHVTVASTGNIRAGGPIGIVAESQVLGGAGNAGDVAITSTGDISGGNFGIQAGSVAGGAGNAGTVTVTVAGNVTGIDGGILAYSLASTGAMDNISVNLNSGTVASAAIGVKLSGGATNLLAIGAAAAVLGDVAIAGGAGDETVNNFGTVTGSVALGLGANQFNNAGLLNAGTVVDLGATGLLSNAGTLAPGGVGGAPLVTTLTGNFVQAAGGTFAVDVANGTADRVNVSGTAGLAGAVLPTVTGLTSSTQQFTILSAANGTTNNGITVRDTWLYDYELLFPNANDMVLSVSVNFAPAGAALTPNQRVTAGHLQSALNSGGGNLGNVLGYLSGILDVRAYAAALDRLHPEPYLAQVQSALLSSLGFTDSLMSCPKPASADVSAFVAEGQCAWARMGGQLSHVERTTANIGYEDKSWGGSAGVQVALAPSWFGSVALGYERSDLAVDDRAAAAGDLFHAGAGVKYVQSNWKLSGALAGGRASYDTTRFNVMPGVNAEADASLSFVSSRVRAAYVFGSETVYAKPLVDVDAIGIRRRGIHESAAGPAGLNVRGQGDIFFSVAPALEVGGQFAAAGGVLRPFLRAGVRLWSDDGLEATASFIGAPAGAAAFTVTTPLDQWMGEVSAGLEMLSGDRLDARVGYDGRFGERTTQHRGSLKLRARF